MDNNWITSTANSLCSRNREYTLNEIKGMIQTAIYEQGDAVTKKGTYCRVLSRILEEKGIAYKGDSFYTPFIKVPDLALAENEGWRNLINGPDYKGILSTICRLSGLSDKEMFILACYHNVEIPMQGKYKLMLDSLEPQYNSRGMTTKELANILKQKPVETRKIHHSIIKRLEQCCANK